MFEVNNIYNTDALEFMKSMPVYRRTKMNMFCCICVSIFFFSINYLFCSIILIGDFLYWITHTGRKGT